jgi:hypothetical protein
MGNTTSSGQNTASNSATNANTNYGSNTNSNTAQNTANNSITQAASGPSAAAQGFLNTINPMNTAANINAFQNPYMSQVLGAQQALQQQQGGEAQAQLLGNSPGAINGNRLGEAQATLQRQLQLANNATNTGILSQGFNTAANLAMGQGQQALGAAGLAGTQSSQGTQQLGSTQGATQAGTLGGTSTAQSTAQAGTGSGSQTTSPGILSYAGLGAGLLAKDGGAINYASGGAPQPLKVPKSFPIASIGDFGELHFVPKKHPKKFGDGGTAGGDQADPYSMEGIQKAIKAMLDRSQGTAGNKPAQGNQSGQGGFNMASDQFNSGAKIGQGLATAGQNIGNKLFGSSQDANSQGLLGSGGLGSTLSDAASGIGDFAGFAKGGSADQAATPSSSFYSPVSAQSFSLPASQANAASPATSDQYYTPISFSPVQAQMPNMAGPQVGMPSIPGASAAQASVPFPTAPRASSGKGSGGAVRGYYAGGRPRGRETGTIAAHRDRGGGLDDEYTPAEALVYSEPAGQPQEAPAAPPEQKVVSAPQPLPSAPASAPPATRSLSGPQPGSPQTVVPDITSAPKPLPSAPPPSAVPTSGPQPIGSPYPAHKTIVPDITASQHLEGGLGSYSRDSKGSWSYGTHGLNSTGSAQEFQRDYPELGLTEEPGTPAFNKQWSKLAYKHPEALIAAETDWHNKNIGANVLPSLQHTGVSDTIARDPRVQAYVADRMVQQGEGSTVNHQTRFQQAEAASGGDPAKFLQALTQIDKAHVRGDFKSYLADFPDHVKGLENRSDRRLAAALGTVPVEGTRSLSGGREIQPSTGREVQSSALGRIASALGINPPAAQGAGNKYLINGPIGEGARGILGALGVNTSPESLGKVSRLLMAMGQGQGFQGGMGNEELLLKQEHARREAQHLASQLGIEQGRLKLEQAKFAQPIKIGEFQDFSGTHAIYGKPTVNPQTGETTYTPVNAPAAGAAGTEGRSPGMTPLSQIDPNLHGEELLKQANLSAPDAALVRKLANYDFAVSAVAAIKKPELVGLVAQYKPGWDEKNYAAQQAVAKKISSGTWADAIVAANKTVNHVSDMISHVDDLGNYSSDWFNEATGPLTRQYSKQYQDAIGTFTTDKLGVAGELAKVFKGTGVSAEQEVQEWKKHYSEYGAPTLLKSGAKEALHMMMGQLDPLAAKYNQEMRYSPGDPGYKTGRDFLSPEAKVKFDKIMKGYGKEAGTSSGTVTAIDDATGHRIGLVNNQWYDLQTGQPIGATPAPAH